MSLLRHRTTGAEIQIEGVPGELIAGGSKYDDGKLRYDLIPAYPMEQLAAVYTFGAHKYDDFNWAKGIKYSRLIAALFRHLWAFVRGDDIDPESKLPHLAHAAWNVFTLLYFWQYRKDLDDRFRDSKLVWREVPWTADSVGGSIQSRQTDSSPPNTGVRNSGSSYQFIEQEIYPSEDQRQRPVCGRSRDRSEPSRSESDRDNWIG